jgi:glycerol kinase
MASYILGIDEGTSSTRAILLNDSGILLSNYASKKITQIFPQPSWVEHNPMEIWENTLAVCQQTINLNAIDVHEIIGIAITNQRETTVLWERSTGKPIYNAIVWQDRRGASECHKLVNYQNEITQKTGLILESYFCATKIKWILDNVPDARELAAKGQLAFGTIDCFLLWQLTNGQVHATDITNASRTLLFNIHTLSWDQELLKIFDIPESILPMVNDCTYDYGFCEPKFFGRAIPIKAIAGDQHAALFGQTCFKSGMSKSTFGTGCFIMANTGHIAQASNHRLLTTIAYKIEHKPVYAIEGSIFMAGAIMQWLRDNLGILTNVADSAEIAAQLKDTNGVYIVPAFTGLGAPHWLPHAKALITGLTRDSTKNHLIRAALESVVYQVYDLIASVNQDIGNYISELRIDGGLTNNLWFNQFLADILNIPIAQALNQDTTIFGVSLMAGLHAGMFDSLEDLEKLWQSKQVFKPQIDNFARQKHLDGWQQVLKLIV